MKKLTGRAVGLAVGVGDAVETRPVETIELSLEGIAGDRHAGVRTAGRCSRALVRARRADP